MGKAQMEEKLAVEAGYWYNFRYQPWKREQGENPFILDSREPKGDYLEFLNGEVRYNALTRQNKERAEELFGIARKQAEEKYQYWKALSDGGKAV